MILLGHIFQLVLHNKLNYGIAEKILRKISHYIQVARIERYGKANRLISGW